ncbi:hypothetical protein [Pseudoalteromonas umbrosa]|uniref:hypothetical protein n=1 Tax=Pseudoalteromonas umbrosa TaxID=3048489 RepID=UPI0024C453C9|nr:hypothetical protein [Pseudoalteromonas sp. B95]MDK1286837.1 hypothetical protein [Pseudoalteromonas sp. B95]
MKIPEYYQKAKEVAENSELQGSNESQEILNALNYDRLDDHPSCWVPNVQKALLECFKARSDIKSSQLALDLYIEGEIMWSKAERKTAVKVGFTCLILGILIGGLVWS